MCAGNVSLAAAEGQIMLPPARMPLPRQQNLQNAVIEPQGIQAIRDPAYNRCPFLSLYLNFFTVTSTGTFASRQYLYDCFLLQGPCNRPSNPEKAGHAGAAASSCHRLAD